MDKKPVFQKVPVLFFQILVLLILIMKLVPPLLGYSPFVVTSGSMEPSIPAASAVYVKPVSFDALREGMVITFSLPSGNTVVTHRITGISRLERKITTKGDANPADDASPVTEKQIIGAVRYCIPRIGRLYLFFDSREGKTAVLALLFIILTGPSHTRQERRHILSQRRSR